MPHSRTAMTSRAIVSRFAPAPTGYLHVGHVVNALYVWGVTRAAGGRVLLRIEDHDRQRSRRVYEHAILDDLEWLGFIPDEPVIATFHTSHARAPCAGRQSERSEIYSAALARLREEGRVYACECSRNQVMQVAANGDELRYPGTCRAKGLAEAPGRSVRVRLDETVESFDDLRHGHQTQCPIEQCGDLLVRDRDGNWTYQFAVTVDDLTQGVTLVIRGDDLLASTGRQIQLARLLGRAEPPRFLHHALVMKSSTQKLSKADRDTSVRDLRARGLSAADVIGQAAHCVGLVPDARPLAAASASALPSLVAFARSLSHPAARSPQPEA
jgi:glutamyl/glutaminyl-tRNA synthetase